MAAQTPDGFGHLFPYFFVDDAPGFCRFLVEGLGAEELGRNMDGDRIANAQLCIGTVGFMVSEAVRDFPAMAASYYIFVDDADAAQARAIAAGATEIMPVADRDYGDRQGGVKDRWGNVWWVSQRIETGPYKD